MNLTLLLSYLFTILLFLFLLYKRQIVSLLIKNQKFKCKRCGICCETFNAEVREQDIKNIEKHGYKRKEFVENKGSYLSIKRINNRCIFLKIEKGRATCTIHDFQPISCQCFPLTKVLGIKCYDSRCKAFKIPKWLR